MRDKAYTGNVFIRDPDVKNRRSVPNLVQYLVSALLECVPLNRILGRIRLLNDLSVSNNVF